MFTFEGKDIVFSPLHFACHNHITNSTEIIDALLTNGTDIDEVSIFGSALCTTALNGKTKLVRHLLRRGARIGLAGPDGYKDLHGAAKNGHSGICKILVEHGADINSQQKYYSRVERYFFVIVTADQVTHRYF